MVSWMAGLFYLPRLFVYHAEAQQRTDATRDVLAAQYTIMEQRLLGIITTPAMLMTWLGGLTMMGLNAVAAVAALAAGEAGAAARALGISRLDDRRGAPARAR